MNLKKKKSNSQTQLLARKKHNKKIPVVDYIYFTKKNTLKIDDKSDLKDYIIIFIKNYNVAN